MRYLPTAVLGLCIGLTTGCLAEPLTIGAWNIQDLHHREGHSLRKFGDSFSSVRRQATDFELLLKYRDLFGREGSQADVIALQEIGTPEALERLFPDDEYETIMSPRWVSNPAEEGAGDVFTAIAVRRGSGLNFVQSDPLTALAVLHSDGRPTRAGTGALLEYEEKRFWFLSVHLKSSCASTKAVHLSTNDNCETLWKQLPVLRNWIVEKQASGIPFIIAGDFNRRFRQLQFGGPVWKALNGVQPDSAISAGELEAHPATVTRNCPTRKGDSTQPIDWFVLDAKLAVDVVEESFWERRFSFKDVDAAQNGRGLSDHCPISIAVRFTD